MKLFVMSIAIAATVLGALPVSAQVVVRDRDDNAAVVIRDHDRDRDQSRNHHRWWRHHAECKTVRVRTELPNGNVIFKTRRTCD